MNAAELRETERWQSARDLRDEKMHTTKRLCAMCRDTFKEEPTPEELAVAVWSVAEKMPKETMQHLLIELLAAHLRREQAEAGNAG